MQHDAAIWWILKKHYVALNNHEAIYIDWYIRTQK